MRTVNTGHCQATLFLGLEHKATAMNVGILKRTPLKNLRISATFWVQPISKNTRS